MKNAFLLAHKELKSFFCSWVGVFTFVFFYVLTGIFFALLIMNYGHISMEASKQGVDNIQGLGLTRYVFSSLFLNLSVLLLFLVPAMSMRSFAEEKKMQTLELLYTYPFSDFEIVWGKFLGMVWIFELLFIPTLSYIALIHWLGGSLDWKPIFMAYLGFWMLGNAYLSFGLFVSTLTENQVVSALGTFAGLIVLWVFDWVTTLFDGSWAQFLKALSPLNHYQEFTLGILDLSHVAFFLFFHLFFLFLSLRSIEARNWKI